MPAQPPSFQVLLPAGGRIVAAPQSSLEAAREAVCRHLGVRRLPRPLHAAHDAEFYAAPSGRHAGIEKPAAG